MLNRFPSVLLTAAVVALALGLCPALAEAQAAPTLDHFWCYRISGIPPEELVVLHDQFDHPIGPELRTLVRNPVRFCNPVEKTDAAGVVTPITNIDAHLKLYLMHVPELTPIRKVRVKNQFGRQRLKVFDPLLLGVPTAKNTQPDPKGLDHFKCYRADGPALRNKVVKLKDQFNEVPATVTVLFPIAFCNPAEKEHGDLVFPIENPRGHLVCYAATPSSVGERSILMRNQFSDEERLTSTADILCVPSVATQL